MALLFKVSNDYVEAQAARIRAIKEATDAAKHFSGKPKAKAKAKKEVE